MDAKQVHVVTGAFGYSGKYIARRLLTQGHEVRTLTNSLHKPNPYGERVQAIPFSFGQPDKLVESLRNAKVLYNTYWVRFNHENFGHETAVANTLTLFNAAKEAGVERIVHVSITNPSLDSHLEYFSGKAQLEAALQNLGVSYAILRPTVLFGKEDILINNIAWMLRHFPLFGVFGDGRYRLQPIYVDDLAKLAVEQGQLSENRIIDAIGPETFTYRELVLAIGKIVGRERPLLSIPPSLGYAVGWIVGKLVNDVIITRPEIEGLMADLLYVDSPPAGQTKLTEWARQHAAELGHQYASELGRRRQQPLLQTG